MRYKRLIGVVNRDHGSYLLFLYETFTRRRTVGKADVAISNHKGVADNDALYNCGILVSAIEMRHRFTAHRDSWVLTLEWKKDEIFTMPKL